MIKEITDKFLLRLGLKRNNDGADNDCSALMPLLMMDNAYSLFSEYIKPLPVKHRLNHLRKEWEKAYHIFNHSYFYAFDDEQSDFVLDMMDRYEDFIRHNMELTFLEVTTAFMDVDIEKRKAISAAVLMNILCQTSDIMWDAVFEKVFGKHSNKPILHCEKIIHDFANEYYGEEEPLVNLNQQKRLHDCVNALCRKQMQFVDMIIKENEVQ